MTRIGIVADVHCGNHRKHGGDIVAGLNRRCREVIATLARAAAAAKEAEVDAFVIAGDLFDTARPNPQMLAAVQCVLEDLPTIVLVGNHDRVSDLLGDHALGPLAPIATVVENVQAIPIGIHLNLMCVPYFPGHAANWFEQEVAKLAQSNKVEGVTRLLCFHLGVEDENTSHFLRGQHDSIHKDLVAQVMIDYGIEYAFAGNWHTHQHWYVKDGEHGIVQCGTLAPTGWDNEGTDDYGMLVLFDTEATPRVRIEEIPGPRFVDVSGPTAVDSFIAKLTKEGQYVYARWRAGLEDLQGANEEIREWIDAGLIVGGHVEAEDNRAEAAAREAAKVTGKAETLAEALAVFVEKMPLVEGVDRALVLAQAQEFLAGGE